MNINLPKYNQTVYAELLQAMVWNNKCALCAATGTGKSYIAAKFVQEAVIEQDTLILVPFRASAKIWNTLLPQATTMTYQGLLYNRPELAKYKLIICDEMHHLGADEWGKVFNELMENYHGKLLGLTATPIRFLDGNRNIAKEFFDGNDIQGVQLSEAIQKKILPTFEYVTALYDLPESKGNNELTEKLYSRLDFLRNEYSFQNILRKHLAGILSRRSSSWIPSRRYPKSWIPAGRSSRTLFIWTHIPNIQERKMPKPMNNSRISTGTASCML